MRAYHKAKLICPLLNRETHACMVYADRPLACRGHYLVGPDASPCKSRDVEPTITTLIVDDGLTQAIQKIAAAWIDGTGTLRMNAGLLVRALRFVWLEGGKAHLSEPLPDLLRQ